jgi:hypothetical protein
MESMAKKISRTVDPFDAGSRNRRLPNVLSKNEHTEGLLCEGSAEYRAMLEEGLRLNRAFFNIRSASIREAIINLIVETANNESGDGHRFPWLI